MIGALPQTPDPTGARPPGWNFLIETRRVGLWNEKHPWSWSNGGQLCHPAQDLLGCLVFLSFRTVYQLGRCKGMTFPPNFQTFSRIFSFHDCISLIRYGKKPIFSPSERILTSKRYNLPSEGKKAEIDPFLSLSKELKSQNPVWTAPRRSVLRL